MLNKELFIFDLGISDRGYKFATDITSALSSAENELLDVETEIHETEQVIKKLTPDCDKLDYILAASSGIICGIIDIIFVGKPNESKLQNLSDEFAENKIKLFAKIKGWDNNKNESLKSAIRFLEKKYDVPYDQSHIGSAAKNVFNLTPSNHRFKSLGHNFSIMGLFFSILDQFCNTSHFISDGELITLYDASNKFVLKGDSIPSKIFFGFVNWIRHLISDSSGTSTSKGRGMGLPSPLFTWINDIIVIKNKLNIPVTEFDNIINDYAMKMYKEGYDIRFQQAQAIPVFINEIIVRFVYSIRRIIKYFQCKEYEQRSLKNLWEYCNPIKNATIHRMLTVAHGTFCMLDVGDAAIRGFVTAPGSFNIKEFLLRINIVGIGRFTISIYGELDNSRKRNLFRNYIEIKENEERNLSNYIEGLKHLSEIYDDKEIIVFIDDFQRSGLYKEVFNETIFLAEQRKVPDKDILKTKEDIEKYFLGG